ncbi:MAG: carbohydrate-binding protein, partial [Moraxellaceae bacterium]
MFKKKESTRLGEILVSKGLITSEQLSIATHEQAKRNRLLNASDSTAPRGVMIGEVLVEFGFIDQLELKRGLNWQQRLRHVSIAMALCAPFMTFIPSSAVAQTTSSVSSSSAASRNFTPTIIEAENYSSMNGVMNEPTKDTGGGQNIGYVDTNDWMAYANKSVYIPVAGNYKVTFRVASLSGGGVLALKEGSTDATLDTFSVPTTGNWQTWVDVVRTVNLTQGTHTFKLFAVSGGFNVNWFKFDLLPSTMPLTIRTENYSAMNGVINEATKDTGGGKNTGYIDALDWMAFNNVDVVIPTTASYKITYRVASFPGGGKFTLNEAGTSTVLDTVVVPKTGDWQNWVNVEQIVTLTAGKHNFSLNAVIGGFNINWFKLEPVSSAVTTAQSSAKSSVVPITSSSSSSKAAVVQPISSSASSTPLAAITQT